MEVLGGASWEGVAGAGTMGYSPALYPGGVSSASNCPHEVVGSPTLRPPQRETGPSTVPSHSGLCTLQTFLFVVASC